MIYLQFTAKLADVDAEREKGGEHSISGCSGAEVFQCRQVLGRILERLSEVGTERVGPNHRTLHMDQYGTLLLLWLISPIIYSLRGVQPASGFKKLQNKFGISQTSLGSLSKSVRIFDPERLKEIARMAR